MVQLYPLEGELERRLPEVGIELGERISREQLIAIARHDDEVDEMLGDEGHRKEYGEVSRGELGLEPTETLLYFIFEAKGLSEVQREVEDDRDLILKRTGIRKPWRVVYDVHQYEGYSNITEAIDVYYRENNSSLFSFVGRQDGVTDINLSRRESYSKYGQPIQRMVESLRKLDRILTWDPEYIAEIVVRFIGDVENESSI